MKRISQTKLNIATSVLLQVVSGVCGLILPRFILRSFGSEVNGLVASVGQLLSYAVLLEGGIGGVMRAALYKPLANEDDAGISGIFYQIRRTFRKISIVFIGLAVLLSICMKFLVETQYDWLYVFTLVLTSVVVFLLNPLVQWLYVKGHYNLSREADAGSVQHIPKRDGAIHHLSYFIHRNTDVVILSLLGSLQTVSVYAVYHTVINVLEQLLLSISSGLSGLVGRLIARKEIAELNRIVDRYEACNNVLATSVATV